tara:strand:+ start:249 stop:485 length:237 start_codon:yes stop_codon:yes gene_type:complete
MQPQNLLFTINPEFAEIPKMNTFLNRRYHITFEMADIKNKTSWFLIAKKKGYLEAMIAYTKTTIFEWENFNNWLKTLE